MVFVSCAFFSSEITLAWKIWKNARKQSRGAILVAAAEP